MLQDVIHPPEQLPNIHDVSSPISAQILELCDPEFLETLQNSEVTSSSNCCYEENSSYTNTNLSLPPDNFNCGQDSIGNTNIATPTATTNSTAPTTTSTTTANTNSTDNRNNSNLSIIFSSQDELDNDISTSIDFSSSATFPVPPQYITTQFDLSSVQPQMTLSDVLTLSDVKLVSGRSGQFPADPVAPLMAQSLPSVFEEDCLSSVPSYVPLNPSSPSCSFLGPAMSTYMPADPMTAALSADSSGIFTSGLLLGSELQPQDLDYQGDNAGIYCPDPIQRLFSPGEFKALSNEAQQLVGGPSSSTPLTTEISSLEDSTFKVGKLSVEQRKEKIHRYMKKRNERNFSKKIKYACRKTLADSRPRVRGRFAKNDDFGKTPRAGSSNHEEDDDDEEVAAKGEEDMVDSSDIFAHISGVNSFKCNYPIQSWI